MVVAGTAEAITMVECGSSEVSEEELIEALGFAHENIKKLAASQKELAAKAGKPKTVVPEPAPENEVEEVVKSLMGDNKDTLCTPEKIERVEKFRKIDQKLDEQLVARFGEEVAGEKHEAAKRILE